MSCDTLHNFSTFGLTFRGRVLEGAGAGFTDEGVTIDPLNDEATTSPSAFGVHVNITPNSSYTVTVECHRGSETDKWFRTALEIQRTAQRSTGFDFGAIDSVGFGVFSRNAVIQSAPSLKFSLNSAPNVWTILLPCAEAVQVAFDA